MMIADFLFCFFFLVEKNDNAGVQSECSIGQCFSSKLQSLPGELEAKFAVLKQQIPLEGSALRNSQNQFVLLLLPVEFID